MVFPDRVSVYVEGLAPIRPSLHQHLTAGSVEERGSNLGRYLYDESSVWQATEVIVPDETDVLLGRGKSNQNNPGNVLFNGMNELTIRFFHMTFSDVPHSFSHFHATVT
jgi:hypothetical protein